MKMPMKKSFPITESSDDSDDFGPKEKRQKMEKDSHEYVARRERNNIAVRKSREKSRAKAKETMEQVNKLRKENENLEQKVSILSKELSVLKDLFLAHAGDVNNSIGTCPSPPPTTVTVQVTASPNDHQYSAKTASN
ncbi:CCAAT/enhancer-binding protein gamma-like [Mya arenaria]|uniref:CCAAT/enhancer-binding protein gamma-like n=1 Tax=Mya arenaria TaxID=6604 RepID=UPI0022E2FF5E|nr:CCAAT/enhancer-binding protein gamma-like [Mya arenaria]